MSRQALKAQTHNSFQPPCADILHDIAAVAEMQRRGPVSVTWEAGCAAVNRWRRPRCGSSGAAALPPVQLDRAGEVQGRAAGLSSARLSGRSAERKTRWRAPAFRPDRTGSSRREAPPTSGIQVRNLRPCLGRNPLAPALVAFTPSLLATELPELPERSLEFLASGEGEFGCHGLMLAML
jgi:hypothetical protein